MNELLEILNDIDDSVDWENEEGLIDRHLLDSFGCNHTCIGIRRYIFNRSGSI